MGTKIFILGAVGAMCIEATRDLIETSGYEEFMLADMNLDKCNEIKDLYKDKNVKTMELNGTDPAALKAAFQGYDFVMNGLPFGIVEPSVKVCMEMKIPTILLDDFPQDYYEKGWDEAGVLCAAGVGMTPGMTDLMARWAVDRLDSVERINVSWASMRPIAISPGLVLTTFWEMHPEEKGRAYFENGEMHPQPPLQESKRVEFADHVGPLDVYYVPHPETVRLAQHVKGIKKVVTMGTWPPVEMEFLKQIIDFGVFDKQEITHKGQTFNTQDLFGDLMYQLPRGTKTTLWGYALHVESIGKRGDKDVRYVLKTEHPDFKKWGGERAFAKNVAIPMSIGCQMMINGQVKLDKGYHIAYEIFEPELFFKEMEKRGISTHEQVFEEKDNLGK